MRTAAPGGASRPDRHLRPTNVRSGAGPSIRAGALPSRPSQVAEPSLIPGIGSCSDA
jgi:hypothetical protein